MRELVDQVLDSERISYGPLSKRFEQMFASQHGCQYGVLSNSGTSSLQVALQTLKELHNWKDGDEVIIPAVTFVATVNIVLHNKMTPVLVDVERDYYGIDPELIESAITPRTKAIIPVHLFGMPCDMAAVYDVLLCYDEDDIKVIEDSCECMFAKHFRDPVGSWSDIGCFSTYVAHILTTGVGGIATTNKECYAKKMRSLVNHGLDFDQLPDNMTRDFVFESVGHSFRITELEAALGVAQLECWHKNIETRQRNAAILSAGLEHLSGRLQLPAIRPNTTHSFMMYPIVCRQDGVRDDLRRFLADRGIESRLMLPLTNQPVYSGLWNPNMYPVARRINEQGFYIGCHDGLTRDDLDYVLEAFEEFFK
jgi:dTDP-4-amino-4,6-dideoxygalactose transaminase